MNTFWNSEYIDLWSVPHFLFGVVLAQVVRTYDVDIVFVAVVMITVAVLWEFFELSVRILETKKNSVIDVALSLVGFSLMMWGIPTFTDVTELNILLVVLGLWLGFNVSGFLAGGWKMQKRSKKI